MTSQIEAMFGTTVAFPEETSIGAANRKLTEKGDQGKDSLNKWADEFDTGIGIINSLKPSQVDERITPTLRKTLENLNKQGLHLPTLKELRESQDPEVKESINQVMTNVKNEMTKEKGQWKWLNELITPRLITSSLLFDGYNDIIRQDQRFQFLGFADDNNVIGRSLEEASILFHPEFGINRAASRFYTAEEGFTQDFIDYSQAVRLIEACRILEPNILSRRNMDRVWKFIRENPYDVLDLMRTLNMAVGELNLMTQGQDIDNMLKNVRDSQKIVKDRPIPLFLGKSEITLLDLIRNLKIVRRALKITNSHMKVGESVNRAADLAPEVQDSLTYARFHVDVSDPRAIFAGLVTHMVEYWTKGDPTYQALERDTMINALCEVIGYKHADSDLFRLLYNPNGLNWYAVDWGFTQEFVDHLYEQTKISKFFTH